VKILFAEDTKDLNRAVTVLLQHEGYEVDSALDGEEAISFIDSGSYDAIILDIMMPKKDGMQVLSEIRGRHILTPVLLLTAKAEVDDRVAGLDAGADDYLPKPFAMKELLARVRAMLRRYSEYTAQDLSFEDVYLKSEDFSLTSENSVRLSIKEFELMQLLMNNTGGEVSTDFILEHVWNGEDEAGSDMVWLYICYLKFKLQSVGSAVTIMGNEGGSFRLISSRER